MNVLTAEPTEGGDVGERERDPSSEEGTSTDDSASEVSSAVQCSALPSMPTQLKSKQAMHI